jgi:H+-translocating NAD(P) transhydrogenase subunit alpha
MIKVPTIRRTKMLQRLRASYPVLSTKYSVHPLATYALLAAALFFLATSPLLAEPTGTPAHPPASAASTLPTMLFVFMLATFIGLGVITRVSRLLHTPLMSLTNAISAIAAVGAIAVAGAEHPFYINLLGAIALFASMTNIVSGFLITDRMLKMFRR